MRHRAAIHARLEPRLKQTTRESLLWALLPLAALVLACGSPPDLAVTPSATATVEAASPSPTPAAPSPIAHGHGQRQPGPGRVDEARSGVRRPVGRRGLDVPGDVHS